MIASSLGPAERGAWGALALMGLVLVDLFIVGSFLAYLRRRYVRRRTPDAGGPGA